jgi:hypothetical protein
VSGFICKPPEPGEQPSADETIINDGWFPDIDPAALRPTLRLRDTVTAPRLRSALLGAMITVARDLDAWATDQRAKGIAELAAVPAPQLDGKSRLVTLYERAVSCFALAELTEKYRGFDMTGAGQREVDALAPSIDDLRRDGRYAIRDIKGVGRSTVELI